MRRRKKKKTQDSSSMIGRIIDMPLEQFQKELIDQKVNIGVMSNIILNLEATYFQLRTRKDGVLDLVYKGIKKNDDPEIQKAMNGLYAEMTKVEQKITYLKQRRAELVDVDKAN